MKNVKKIFLLATLILSIFCVSAQTKKPIKLTSKQKAANAKFAKAENKKAMMRDSAIFKLNMQDSVRYALDSITDVQKDSARTAYRDSGYKAVDSLFAMQNKTLAAEANDDYKANKFQEDIASSSKLSAYQESQIIIINKNYSNKAKLITNNSSLQSKAADLIKLNELRQAEITTVVGKRKAKIIEQQRRSYSKKMGASADMVWIDVAEQGK